MMASGSKASCGQSQVLPDSPGMLSAPTHMSASTICTTEHTVRKLTGHKLLECFININGCWSCHSEKMTSWRNTPKTLWNVIKANTRAQCLAQNHPSLQHWLWNNWQGPSLQGKMQRSWWTAGWTRISTRLSWQWGLTPPQAALARLKAVGWEEWLFMLSIYADSSGILSLVFRSSTKKEMLTNWRESRRLPPPQWAGWRIKKNPREAERSRLVSIVERKAAGSWKQHNLIEAFYHQKVKVTDKSLPDSLQLQSKKEGGRVDNCH